MGERYRQLAGRADERVKAKAKGVRASRAIEKGGEGQSRRDYVEDIQEKEDEGSMRDRKRRKRRDDA